MLGVGGDVGYGGCEPKSRRYCTRYKTKKNVGGGGGGAIFESKTLSMYSKKKTKKKSIKKKLTELGLEPTTSGFEIH